MLERDEKKSVNKEETEKRMYTRSKRKEKERVKLFVQGKEKKGRSGS